MDPEKVTIARCPNCGRLPRPTLMGRTICDQCGGLDVPQPPSSTVMRQIEALANERDTASVERTAMKICLIEAKNGRFVVYLKNENDNRYYSESTLDLTELIELRAEADRALIDYFASQLSKSTDSGT